MQKYSALFMALIAIFIINTPVFGNTEKPVSLEYFAALPKFSTPVLSPVGDRVASTITYQGQPLLVVQSLDPGENQAMDPMVPINAGKSFFNWYGWANEERLLFSLRGTIKIQGDLWNISRLGSIGSNGKEALKFRMTPNYTGLFLPNPKIIDYLDDDPELILATLDDQQGGWAVPEVHRVNVNTGKRQRIERNKIGAQSWIADSNGVLRIGIKIDTEQNYRNVTIYYRETKNDDWEKLQKIDYFDEERLIPFRFDEDDPNILLVSTRGYLAETGDEDVELFAYDLTQRKVIGPYEDSHRKSVLNMVRQVFPGSKADMVSRNKEKNRYTFIVYSDVQAPEYFLFDLHKKSLRPLAKEYPALQDVSLSPMQKVSYLARDDREIPAFLTIPIGSEGKNLPVVVYPHGGPWAHDEWGFDNYVQFFASRGYAVLQPQFRGSTGYGLEHEQAGYGQWGHAIQDDIEDGVNWLVEQGIADPDRICIVGSSFGGYAAAMGVAKTPELYRCAISINGVLDLEKLVASGRKLLFSTINRAIWNSSSDIKSASPFHLAMNIVSPVLLIGSELDTIVPVEHSKTMYKKLKKLDKPVEYIELAEGEHWRTNEANEIKVFAAMEQFLHKNLAPREAAETQ